MDNKTSQDFGSIMNILHIITTLDAGGAEKQLVSLVRNQLLSRNKVHVIYLKGNGELSQSLKMMGCNVHSVRQSPLGILDVRTLIDGLPIDIVHAHLPRSEIAAYLAHASIPFVVSRHNAEQFWPRKNRKVSAWFSRLITNKASAVISISRGVKDFVETTNEISKNTRHEVVHYGYDSKDGKFSPKKLMQDKSLRFLCVSRLVEQKDIPTLLKAFGLHLKSSPESTLTIVGTGHLKKQLYELANQLRLSNSVFWIDHSLEIKNIYRNHDCLVLTSLYEGFGLVLLEAMQFGLAIIASSHTVTQEVLSKSHPGLFPIGDFYQLAKLMNGVMNVDTFSRNAHYSQSRLEFFSPEENCRKIRDIYLDCLNG